MNKKRHDKSISYISVALLMVVHTLIFAWIWYLWYHPMLMIPFYRKGSYLMLLLFAICLTASNHIFGGLRLGYYKVLDSIVARTLSLFTSYFMMYIIISLLSYRLVSLQYIGLAVLLGFFFNIFWTMLSNYIYYRVNPPRQMLLIYGDRPIDEVYSKISSRSEKYEIVKRIHCNAGEEKLKQVISRYEAVILHDLSASLRNHLIKYCYENSIRVYVTPKLYDIMIRGASDMDLFDTPFLLMRNRGLTPFQAFIKRSMDLLISITCLVITAPVMLLIVILIKCMDKGPVLYRQTRLTLNGKEFEILKFRSMYVDAEKDSIRLMAKGDDRITPIGRVLRRTHLDELPQLFNIIRGDMSFVGPRPERPEIASIYMSEIPEFSYRLKMKAGLTGYAQVYGKYNSTPYDKLKLDLTYIQNYSVFLDIRLLLLTGKTLFIPDHAEGVSSNFKTALRAEVAVTKEEDTDDQENKA
ncbi:MAG: sugar transferase [Lachnospiraceae bacterium]|nr:sugar transferase [Lachnospiraceae bacterium]